MPRWEACFCFGDCTNVKVSLEIFGVSLKRIIWTKPEKQVFQDQVVRDEKESDCAYYQEADFARALECAHDQPHYKQHYAKLWLAKCGEGMCQPGKNVILDKSKGGENRHVEAAEDVVHHLSKCRIVTHYLLNFIP